MAYADFEQTGRGMLATQDIECGEVCVSVPLRFLITTETALASELGDFFLKNKHSFQHPVQILVVFLLFEKSKGLKSFWHPYINILPTQFTTTLYFTEQELEELQNKEMKQYALMEKEKLFKFYCESVQLLKM